MKNKTYNIGNHIFYTKRCKKVIKTAIALRYPSNEQENVFDKINDQYCEYLRNWGIELGGKKNFHNGKGGTYDCVAILTYYKVCKDKTNPDEIAKMMEDITLPTFKKLRFVDFNKPIYKKLMYKSFLSAKKRRNHWKDYKMDVAPYDKNKPIYYEFTFCPVADFAKRFGFEEIMPSLCKVDYKCLEIMHAKLIREHTCVETDRCDYTIYGDEEKH